MNNSKYRFTLDMHSTISQVSLPVRENDAGIELRITLTDGGTPYHIADGCRAVFCARKSDDHSLLNDCRIEKNTTIYYKLTPQTTAEAGIVDCEIRVYGVDNNLLTTPKFIIVVSDRVRHDEDFHLESDDEKHAIDRIFQNETAREEAEKQRELAEAEREQTYNEMLDTVREASEVADTLSEKLATGDYNGQNGLTPFIGANGNWWIGDEDTGVLADGFSIPLRTGSGENSVEQIGCEAREENSVALGEGTIASARGQFVAGRYNKENPNALLIVGNGTSKDNPSNSVEVLKDGTLVGDGVLQMATGTVEVLHTRYDTGYGGTWNNYHGFVSYEIPLGFRPSVVYIAKSDSSECFTKDSLVKDNQSFSIKNGLFKYRSITPFSDPYELTATYRYVALGKTDDKVFNTLTLVDVDGYEIAFEITEKKPILKLVKRYTTDSLDNTTYYFDIYLNDKLIRSVSYDSFYSREYVDGLSYTANRTLDIEYAWNSSGGNSLNLESGKDYTFYIVQNRKE